MRGTAAAPGPARCPSRGRAQAEVWQGGPGLTRRDRPRPLLPAGEALKHPGEARSPTLGSPDPRARRAKRRPEPLRCNRRHAGHHEAVGVGADFRPVAAGLPGDAGRSVPLQTGQPRRGRSRRGHGQILLGSEALHQPHHQAEVRKEIEPRDTDLRPLVEGKHRKHS